MDNIADKIHDLETELGDIDTELEMLYDQSSSLKPYVSDRVYHAIYDLQQARKEARTKLDALLDLQKFPGKIGDDF